MAVRRVESGLELGLAGHSQLGPTLAYNWLEQKLASSLHHLHLIFVHGQYDPCISFRHIEREVVFFILLFLDDFIGTVGLFF